MYGWKMSQKIFLPINFANIFLLAQLFSDIIETVSLLLNTQHIELFWNFHHEFSYKLAFSFLTGNNATFQLELWVKIIIKACSAETSTVLIKALMSFLLQRLIWGLTDISSMRRFMIILWGLRDEDLDSIKKTCDNNSSALWNTFTSKCFKKFPENSYAR